MTLWVGHEETTSGSKFAVHITSGPVSVTVQEDRGHLRSFWSDLGRVLDKAEKEAEDAERAERF